MRWGVGLGLSLLVRVARSRRALPPLLRRWGGRLPLVAGSAFLCRVGVCCGFFSGFVSLAGGFPWRCVAAVCAVVALARWVGAVGGCLSLACPVVVAVVFRRGRGLWVFVGCRCVGFRVGVVGLGGVSGRCPSVPWSLRACVRCFRAGRGASVAAAVASGGAAAFGCVGAGLVVPLLPLPLLVASVAGCRSRSPAPRPGRAVSFRQQSLF